MFGFAQRMVVGAKLSYSQRFALELKDAHIEEQYGSNPSLLRILFGNQLALSGSWRATPSIC